MTRSEAGRLGGLKTGESLKRRSVEFRENYNAHPRMCATCSEVIPFQKRRNRFCSHSCRAKTINRERGSRSSSMSRSCAGCGGALSAKQKAYCSLKCHASLRRNMIVAAWQAGKISGHDAYQSIRDAVRDYLLAQSQFRCSQCGWGEINPWTKRSTLHIDHVDGNPENSTEANLRVLCPNCHSLTKTHGGTNRGNGRSIRRSRYLRVA